MARAKVTASRTRGLDIILQELVDGMEDELLVIDTEYRIKFANSALRDRFQKGARPSAGFATRSSMIGIGPVVHLYGTVRSEKCCERAARQQSFILITSSEPIGISRSPHILSGIAMAAPSS